MDDEFKDLQRLLRLKRHEAPPPDYFEDFLLEFHQRQRAELLKRPLWRLIVDRIEGALPTIPVSRYAYSGACATALAAAVLASGHILHNAPVQDTVSGRTSGPSLAAASANNFHAPSPALAVRTLRPRFNINTNKASVGLSPELDFDRPRPAVLSYASSRPRYVLDNQPVAYERPYSF